jgi:hypothetical protein
LEIMRTCLGVVAWILIIALAAQFFQAAPWLIFVFGGLIAIGIYISRAKKAALEADTLKIVGDKPLPNILDADRALTASAARMLLGDESYSFEVVGESFYAQNFSALQKNIGLEDGHDWDDQATLIVDPGNKHSPNAVAVFVSGLKLGHVPETNAPGVYKFLLQSGGYAKAEAAIYFSAADGKNSIWLDAVIPVLFKP